MTNDIIDDLLNLHGPGHTNYTCLKAADEIKQLRASERSAWNAAVDREADIDALKADLAAARARVAELEGQYGDAIIGQQEFACRAEHAEADFAAALALLSAPAIALAALQPPPPIIMPTQDWELHQQIQTLNERLAYVEPIVTAARNLVDNAEERECDGLGLWAQHGWWEPLYDALDPDGSAATDDIR